MINEPSGLVRANGSAAVTRLNFRCDDKSIHHDAILAQGQLLCFTFVLFPCHRCAVRMGSGFEGTAPSVCEVAACTGGVSCTIREVASAQGEACATVHSTSTSSGKPCSRSGRRRRSFRGRDWRMRSRCWGRRTHTRAKTTLPPLQERIERARQRVARAEAVIARAMEQKEIHVKEVSDGESRLQTLIAPVLPDVQELQRQIDELRERDLWRAAQTKIHREPQGTWCADGPPSVKEIPLMPTDHQDLQGWVSDRNCDLRNALEFSDMPLSRRWGLSFRRAQHSSLQGLGTFQWMGQPDQR